MSELIEKVFCPVKINLTLRVLSVRSDAYHEIYSVFWKKKATEALTISSENDKNIVDRIEVIGLEINGPNIISNVLDWARVNGSDIPPLHIKTDKHFPAGSGIGAGSGNAAALIKWLVKNYNIKTDSCLISQLGADVSFLVMEGDLAEARGIGEKLTPLEPLEGLHWIIAFPAWKSETALAYSKLDIYRQMHNINVNEEDFSYEALEILRKLRKKERAGLLPNDFLVLLSHDHPEYERAFSAADKAGALAWGLCGSGSAIFAVCNDNLSSDTLMAFYESEDWVIKITKLE